MGGRRAGLACPLPARGAAPALAGSGRAEERDGGQRGAGWGRGSERDKPGAATERPRERSGASRGRRDGGRDCAGRWAGGRAARVSEQVNGEERGGRLGSPGAECSRRRGRLPGGAGGKDRGTGSGKGTGRGAERCRGGMWGERRLASALTRLSVRPPCPVLSPRVCPGLSAGLAPPWTVAASPTCSSPRPPCRLSGPLVTGLAPSPTPALRPSRRPLLVSPAAPSPSRVSVRVSGTQFLNEKLG